MNKTLKKIMIDKNLKINQFARILGVTPHYLSNIINGREPGYPLREKIAFTLDVPYETLWRVPTAQPQQ